MGRHELAYDDYADEDEYWEDEELYDESDLALRERLQRRVVAVFSTSYGISLLAHAALLLILTMIVITGAPEEKTAVIKVVPPPPIKPYDPEVEQALKETPEIKLPENEEVAPVELEDPVIEEIPQGEPDNASNKDMKSDQAADAMGVGATGAAGRFGDPRSKRREAWIGRDPGGSRKKTTVIRAALQWLKRHQSSNGGWDADGWQGQCQSAACKGKQPERCTERGGAVCDVGVTGLATLAFTGDGHSHRSGEFKGVVHKARRWLLRQQNSDGSLGFHDGHHAGAYNHAIATMALCELYGVTRDFTLRRPAQKAVNFTLKCQNPNLGWRYGVKDSHNDTSVTGWQVLALKAARTAGLEVPDAAFAGAQRWFQRATNTSGRTGYLSPGSGSSMLGANEGKYDAVPCMTAVAVVCRIFTGERTSTEAVRSGAKIVAASPPAWSDRQLNFYYWYYGTYAMYQVAKHWKGWEKNMLAAVMPHQRDKGCVDGSWDPVGEWCLQGGRVYATAINALTMEIYYRYARQEDLAKR